MTLAESGCGRIGRLARGGGGGPQRDRPLVGPQRIGLGRERDAPGERRLHRDVRPRTQRRADVADRRRDALRRSTWKATPALPAPCTGRPGRGTAGRSTRRKSTAVRVGSVTFESTGVDSAILAYSIDNVQTIKTVSRLTFRYKDWCGLYRGVDARQLPRLRAEFRARVLLRRRPHRRRARRRLVPDVVRRQEGGVHVHGHVHASTAGSATSSARTSARTGRAGRSRSTGSSRIERAIARTPRGVASELQRDPAGPRGVQSAVDRLRLQRGGGAR